MRVDHGPVRRRIAPGPRPAGRAARARRPRAAAGRAEARAVERQVLATERREQPLGGSGHERVEQHRDHPQALGQRVEHLVEPLRGGLVLGELPRLLVLDVPVEALDALPDLVERGGQLDRVEALRAPSRRGRRSRRRARASGSASGHHAVAVAADHRQRPAGEVAVLVGELGRVARLEPLRRDLAVRAEADLAQHVEAQRVRAVQLDDLERLDHVAERLRHLVLAQQQVAVDADPARDLDARRPSASPAR